MGQHYSTLKFRTLTPEDATPRQKHEEANQQTAALTTTPTTRRQDPDERNLIQERVLDAGAVEPRKLLC